MLTRSTPGMGSRRGTSCSAIFGGAWRSRLASSKQEAIEISPSSTEGGNPSTGSAIFNLKTSSTAWTNFLRTFCCISRYKGGRLLLVRLEPRLAELPQQKAPLVRQFFLPLRLGGAETVPGFVIDAKQNRLAARRCRLQPRRHLAGFPGDHSGIVEASSNHDGGVGRAVLHVVVGAHGVEPFKTLLRLDRAKFGDIRWPVGREFSPHHVRRRHRVDHRGKQVRADSYGPADGDTTGAAAPATQVRRIGILVVD